MPWLDAVIQGILLGGTYAQYALGMALMFGVMRIVNIAHGDLIILLALIGISLASTFGLGPFTVMVLLVPLAAAIGWLLQRVVLNGVIGDDPRPSRSSPPSASRSRCRTPHVAGLVGGYRARCPAAAWRRRRSTSVAFTSAFFRSWVLALRSS